MSDIKLDADKLFYYSKSAHKEPGKGVNENISNVSLYTELSKIKDWRKVLSNFSMMAFTLDGYRWSSVEHYYQGNKFTGEFRLQFTCESKSEIAGSPEMAKAAGGKKGLFKGKIIRPSHISSNFTEFKKHKDAIMYRAMYAKFEQNHEAQKVLLNTGTAELWHGTRGVPPERVNILEQVRNDLKLKQIPKIKITVKIGVTLPK